VSLAGVKVIPLDTQGALLTLCLGHLPKKTSVFCIQNSVFCLSFVLIVVRTLHMSCTHFINFKLYNTLLLSIGVKKVDLMLSVLNIKEVEQKKQEKDTKQLLEVIIDMV
jgi:hypothetical protein